MSTVALPDSDRFSALWTLPTDRVVRVQGPTLDQVAVVLDPLPTTAPVVLICDVTDVAANPVEVRDQLLGKLESVARAQLQVWLPAAEHVADGSDVQRRTARRLAHEIGTTSEHFGPFLAELADSASTGRTTSTRYDPETRARGLARLLRSCYGREAVVLLLCGPHRLTPDARHALGTAAQWLANTASIGTWVLGDGLVDAERFPVIDVPVPPDLSELLHPDRHQRPSVQFPVLSGRPHPGSVVELEFEDALAGCGWAHGRAWNQLYCPHPLAPPLRVDLMWPTERVVVELDGPDHRGAVKYADDRRRDNALTVGGFAVLRFSNEQVAADVTRALAMIEELLVARRRDEGTSGEHRS